VTFGLFRADNPSEVRGDKIGRHGALISWQGEQQRTADNAEMKSLLEHFALQAPSMLQPVREFPEYTVVMTTLWPNLIIQQQSNTLAMRQHRIRQANLMGPVGFVSVDDSEGITFIQDGAGSFPQGMGIGRTKALFVPSPRLRAPQRPRRRPRLTQSDGVPPSAPRQPDRSAPEQV
jgi:salicylate 5-hydroxylase large subunit